MKKIFFLIILLALNLGFVIGSFGTATQRDIGWWLSSMYENAKDDYNTNKKMKELSSPFEWDLYSQAYDLVAWMQTDSSVSAIDSLTDVFNSKDWKYCEQISSEDIINIQDSRSEMRDACKKVISCETDKDLFEMSVTRSMINECRVFVNRKFNQIKSTTSDLNSQKLDWFGDDVFMNWSLEDSPYDLLADVQAIWDLLFKDNEETKSTKMFSLWADDQDHDDALWDGQSVAWSQDQFPTRDPLDEKDESDYSDNNWSNGYEDDAGWVFGWDNALCIAEEHEEKEESKPEQGITQEELEEALSSSQTLQNMHKDADIWSDDIKDALTACMDTDFGQWDTACMKKELCGRTDIWEDERWWEIYATYCTEVRDVHMPVEDEYIKSIEWMLNEVNNVLTKLDQSGQLTKHTKTSDSLDTQLDQVDFGRAFSFDVVIRNKPTFSRENQDQLEMEIEDDYKRLERQILWNYDDINLDSERNKYSMIYDKNVAQAQRRNAPWWASDISRNIERSVSDSKYWLQQYESKLDNLSEITSLSSEAWWVEILDSISKFIENNNHFWQETTKTLENINQISNYLKMKIEETAW